MSVEVPHKVQGWLKKIAEDGPSNRPVPPGESDIVNTLLPDPHDIKPERGAYGAIISTRIYQRTKKLMLAQRERLSLPSLASVFTDLDDLITKNYNIAKTFQDTMVISLIRDERLAKKLPPEHILGKIYRRLDAIVEPTLDAMPEEKKQKIRNAIGKPDFEISGSFLEVQGGIGALPSDMNTLAGNIIKVYIRQFGAAPDVATVLRIMGNSYETYIEFLAKLHQADSKAAAYTENHMNNLGIPPHQIRDDALEFTAPFHDAVKSIREDTKATRSRTITCVFRTPTSQTQPFLDAPADFDDPLRDAFDLHMALLAA